VAGDLFGALGVPVVEGRAFAARDQRQDAMPVAIVNQALVRRYWPGQSAIGKRLRWAVPGMPEFPWRTVVGVVGDTRDSGLSQPARPAFHYPYGQIPADWLATLCRQMTLIAGYRHGVVPAAPTLRLAIQELAPGVSVGEVTTLATALGRTFARPRLYARLTAAFAVAALLLAGFGIHGVLAADVEERRKELGVRIAVGARPGQVTRMVLREGSRLTAIGLLAGLPLGIGSARALAGMLYGISPADPWLTAGVVLTVWLVATAGCLLPARRAATISPGLALQRE
jgi:hypothetical protein